MFAFVIALLFVVCGVALLGKSNQSKSVDGLNIIIGLAAVGLIILGLVLAWYAFSGTLAVPSL